MWFIIKLCVGDFLLLLFDIREFESVSFVTVRNILFDLATLLKWAFAAHRPFPMSNRWLVNCSQNGTGHDKSEVIFIYAQLLRCENIASLVI